MGILQYTCSTLGEADVTELILGANFFLQMRHFKTSVPLRDE